MTAIRNRDATCLWSDQFPYRGHLLPVELTRLYGALSLAGWTASALRQAMDHLQLAESLYRAYGRPRLSTSLHSEYFRCLVLADIADRHSGPNGYNFGSTQEADTAMRAFATACSRESNWDFAAAFGNQDLRLLALAPGPGEAGFNQWIRQGAKSFERIFVRLLTHPSHAMSIPAMNEKSFDFANDRELMDILSLAETKAVAACEILSSAIAAPPEAVFQALSSATGVSLLREVKKFYAYWLSSGPPRLESHQDVEKLIARYLLNMWDESIAGKRKRAPYTVVGGRLLLMEFMTALRCETAVSDFAIGLLHFDSYAPSVLFESETDAASYRKKLTALAWPGASDDASTGPQLPPT